MSLIFPWHIQRSGAKDVTTPVKPISTFVARFEQLLKRVKEVEGNLLLIVAAGFHSSVPARIDVMCNGCRWFDPF